MTTVVLAGGGTAGHIEPALNLGDELRRLRPDARVVALGTTRGLETTLVPERGFDLRLIEPVPMPRRLGKDLLTLPRRVTRAIGSTREVLAAERADVVVGFGGYVSLPAYLAARRAGVPIVVHEANAKPGLANRVGARLTPHVAENHEGSLPGAVRLGCPLRRTIATLDRAQERERARRHFGLDPARPTLLVFGGSQGAQHINSAVAAAGPELVRVGAQILHAVGPRNVAEHDRRAHYHPVGYISRMDLAYAAADVALCRAGAMTCAEVAAVGLPAVYVPYAVGNGEQRFNAEPLVTAGGGLMVADADITGDSLLAAALPLLCDPERAAIMGSAAARYGVADAATKLAELTLSVVEDVDG